MDQPEATIATGEFPSAKPNYCGRHWKGQLTLPVSFWVNGLGFTLVLLTLGEGFVRIEKFVSLKIIATVGILTAIFSILGWVWLVVGIWRSASRHIDERGGNIAWAVLAMFIAFSGVIQLTIVIAHNFVPLIMVYGSILAGDKNIPAYTITVSRDGKQIEFRGGMRAGAGGELKRVLDSTPQAEVLELESTSGRIHEADVMAQLVRQRRLNTYASGNCVSAAALVFLAGRERVITDGARLGFHRGWFPGITRMGRLNGDRRNREIMGEAGMSKAFIDKVMATTPDKMWYPTVDELWRYGVITSNATSATMLHAPTKSGKP